MLFMFQFAANKRICMYVCMYALSLHGIDLLSHRPFVLLASCLWPFVILAFCPCARVHHDIILCIIRSIQSESAIVYHGHPYELPDLWPPNSPDLNAVDYKICGNESARQKRGRWLIWGYTFDWCVSWNGTERCGRCHWPAAQTFPISMPAFEPQEDILTIRCDPN